MVIFASERCEDISGCWEVALATSLNFSTLLAMQPPCATLAWRRLGGGETPGGGITVLSAQLIGCFQTHSASYARWELTLPHLRDRAGLIFGEAPDRILVQDLTPVAGQASHRRFGPSAAAYRGSSTCSTQLLPESSRNIGTLPAKFAGRVSLE